MKRPAIFLVVLLLAGEARCATADGGTPVVRPPVSTATFTGSGWRLRLATMKHRHGISRPVEPPSSVSIRRRQLAVGEGIVQLRKEISGLERIYTGADGRTRAVLDLKLAMKRQRLAVLEKMKQVMRRHPLPG
jgi:hypothetical protein